MELTFIHVNVSQILRDDADYLMYMSFGEGHSK